MIPAVLAALETLRAHHQRQADLHADDPHRHGFHCGYVAALGDVLLIKDETENLLPRLEDMPRDPGWTRAHLRQISNTEDAS